MISKDRLAPDLKQLLVYQTDEGAYLFATYEGDEPSYHGPGFKRCSRKKFNEKTKDLLPSAHYYDNGKGQMVSTHEMVGEDSPTDNKPVTRVR